MKTLMRFLKDEEGTTNIEYVALAALLALALIMGTLLAAMVRLADTGIGSL